MKNRVCFGVPALALLLVHASFAAHAFTLGNLRGSAVIGRALDVSIQVQSDAGEAVSSECVKAQVFYADARQSSVNVSVVPASGASPDSMVRVQSSSAVNEPVVTLEVNATCGSSSRRNYVLLADFPPLAASVATSRSNAGVASVPPVLVLPMTSPAVSGTVATPSQGARSDNAKPVAVQTKPRKPSGTSVNLTPAVGAAQTPVVRKAPVRGSGQSVLKLDPSDFLSDRIDLLDSTSLFAPTEDALRHSRQITSLEGDVKTLRALAASHDARISDLTAKLQQAQQNQMPPWLVYAFAGLVALVLACLAAVLWLWLQLRRRAQQDSSQSWWHGQEGVRDEGPSTELLAPAVPVAPVPPIPVPPKPMEPVPMAVPVPVPPVPMAPSEQSSAAWQPMPTMPVAAAPLESTREVDLDLDLDLDLGFELLQESLHTTFEVGTGNAPIETNSIRHISVEQILDVRQQAEFFVSLGQTDRALQILNKQIDETAEPNPLVYLDLITLYHSLGLKAEFRERREAFHRLFNVVIPDFPVFNLEGHDLESYPEVLANLVSLWPRLDALAFLSACIFRDVQAQHGGTFDLAAFRDLLMLHAVAEDLLPEQSAADGLAGPASFSSVLPEISAAPLAQPGDDLSGRMLDIDFSVPTEPFPPNRAE